MLLGERLGLYRALADGPRTSPELAAATGTDERYVREWCEQQAVAGLIAVDDGAPRRFTLLPGSEAVLVDELSPAYLVQLGGSSSRSGASCRHCRSRSAPAAACRSATTACSTPRAR